MEQGAESRKLMNDKQFRFQDFEIWQRGAALSGIFFKLADGLVNRKLFRFAGQLRGATLNITNNIAAWSGGVSDADFASFLNICRRSVFEVVNMLLLLSREVYLTGADIGVAIAELEEQSKLIMAFRRLLKS